MHKTKSIIKNLVPILVMIGLIPLVQNDYLLTLIYVVIILVLLKIKHHHGDFLVLFFGFIFMTISEYLFISTGVETFIRHSLFGIMPLWLPFLWAYGFVVMKRCLEIIKTYSELVKYSFAFRLNKDYIDLRKGKRGCHECLWRNRHDVQRNRAGSLVRVGGWGLA